LVWSEKQLNKGVLFNDWKKGEAFFYVIAKKKLKNLKWIRENYDYYELLDNFDLGEKHMRV